MTAIIEENSVESFSSDQEHISSLIQPETSSENEDTIEPHNEKVESSSNMGGLPDPYRDSSSSMGGPSDPQRKSSSSMGAHLINI